ncbi:hypothetical protein BT96DRAFT_954057 [Gymnopus androsaceus JB14]|uniref:Co-chaperone HscB C-terminal oligomerisation domain-containing protein n=1 Tax=Gymnopus androsaceus JB14 TaxID=1447944 RepID=A0A6A4IBX3_9AGAR|nr:hypothetical protein BT96DRAFT_954057 [Gymnopus androsaceus JB14]
MEKGNRDLGAKRDPTRLTRSCPSCSQPLPTSLPACPKCWNIWSIPADTSYHKIFSLPEDSNPFVIDTALLRQRFRQMQSTYAAQALSSAINNAYQTLLQPMSRIEYILSQNGHPMEETDKLEDNEFLMNIMMAREEVETAETREEAEPVIQENQAMINETISEIGSLVEQKRWPEAKQVGIRLKYLDGIHKAAVEKL